ncbi:MAG: hypothetical protein ACQEQ0_03495 [Bacteroidota bacterium]
MKKRRRQNNQQKPTLFNKTVRFLQRNQKPIMGIAAAIYVVCSFFTFNLRISEGGDDSSYIIRALNFLEEGSFPGYQGPLYPIILSGLAALGGTSLVWLKITSWIFLSLTLYLFYRAFRNNLSPVVLWGTLFMLIVNHHFLYFGSQTYSEAFFMFLQGLLFLFLFHIVNTTNEGRVKIKHTFLLGLILLLLVLTRTVAIAAIPAVVIFWLLKQKHRAAVTTVVFFLIFAALYSGLRTWLTGDPVHGDEQLSTLMWEDPYDESEGHETFEGFIERFAGNSNIYLSKYLPILTGFKPALSLSKHTLVTILLYGLFILGFIRFLKKRNDPLIFTGLYIAFMTGATFFALQTLWDQVRLIIPFFPFMVIFLAETIVSFTSKSKWGWKQNIPILLLGISILLTGAQTIKQTDFSAIFKNLGGDRYYGYTPDWQNYLKMAEHTTNLPDSTYVACRKPNMARLYAKGKKFYGIYRFHTQDPDSLLNRLHEKDVTHVIVGSLRKNPRENTGQVINTIHRYMGFIADKYPEILKPVKKTGEQEPAWLFEINYDKWKNKPEGTTPETEK